jgi:hypothetical protein
MMINRWNYDAWAAFACAAHFSEYGIRQHMYMRGPTVQLCVSGLMR